jgi:hypothetical protein
MPVRSISIFSRTVKKNDFWRGVNPESVNALFYFEEHGGSILFGARFDPPLAETTDAGA